MSATSATRPTVVVTRPREQAAAWVEALGAAGWPVVALPLIEIAPAVEPPVLRMAIDGWRGVDAVLFVSPAAVAVLRQAQVPPPAAPVRCWAPGAGTADALRAWGVAPAAIDQPPPEAAQMDTDALWPVVAPQVRPGWRLRVVRGISADGHEGRDALLQRCRERGATVETVTAYRRQRPRWDAAQRQAAERLVGPDAIWLFSSSEAIGHLRTLLPDAPWSAARALVTHPRIAAAARALGVGQVATSRPALPEVVQALESMA